MEIGLDDLLSNPTKPSVLSKALKMDYSSPSDSSESDSKEESSHSDDYNPNKSSPQIRVKTSDLGKRRIQNPSLIVDLMSKMKENGL